MAIAKPTTNCKLQKTMQQPKTFLKRCLGQATAKRKTAHSRKKVDLLLKDINGLNT